MWERAAQALGRADAIIEAADPFHVPDRSGETIAFLTGALCGLCLAFAPILFPLSKLDLAILALLCAIVALALVRASLKRGYRLRRAQEVARLRASLEREAR